MNDLNYRGYHVFHFETLDLKLISSDDLAEYFYILYDELGDNVMTNENMSNRDKYEFIQVNKLIVIKITIINRRGDNGGDLASCSYDNGGKYEEFPSKGVVYALPLIFSSPSSPAQASPPPSFCFAQGGGGYRGTGRTEERKPPPDPPSSNPPLFL